MDTLKALELRKSVRGYQDRAVEQEKLERIAAAANQAPNAGPFQVTVVRDKEYLKQVNNAALAAMKSSGNDFLMSRANLPGYQPLYGAPVLVLVSTPDGLYSLANAACAATAMTLAAVELGLGSCYVVTPTLALDGRNELSAKLSLPDGFKPICGVLLGYAGEDGCPAPREKTANINFVG